MSAEESKIEEKQQQKITLNPYLYYKGNASEAMDFYAKHLHGTVDFKHLFSQGPPPILEEFKDCVMHGVVTVNGSQLFFSDSVGGDCGAPFSVGTNVTINISWTDVVAMTNAFKNMSDGGKITMPLDHQFWGATYGSFIDKFDVPWSFNCQDPEPEKNTDTEKETEDVAEKKQRVD